MNRKNHNAQFIPSLKEGVFLLRKDKMKIKFLYWIQSIIIFIKNWFYPIPQLEIYNKEIIIDQEHTSDKIITKPIIDEITYLPLKPVSTDLGVVYKNYETYNVLGSEVNMISDETDYGINTIAEINGKYFYLGKENPELATAMIAWQNITNQIISLEQIDQVIKDNISA
jgi:hypothetical protein